MVAPFTHLHVASGYSLRYGADSPAALVRRAAELGQTSLALTDRDGLYGAVRFALACQREGLTPILGVDLAVSGSGLLPEGPAAPTGAGPAAAAPSAAGRRSPARGGAWVDQRHPRVLLLATGAQGWASLCRLVSAAHLSGERGNPLATVEQVMEHSAGLELLLGPESDVGRALGRRRPDLAAAVLRQWREAFHDHIHCEVVSHLAADRTMVAGGVRGSALPGLPLSSIAAARMLGWAREQQVPAVLGNAVRYAHRSGAQTVDVLDAIRRLVPLDSRHRDGANGEGRLKSYDEMRYVAEEVARLAGASNSAEASRHLIADTVALGERCALDPAGDMGLGQIHVPELDVLYPGRSVAVGGSSAQQRQAEHRLADQILRSRCEEGLVRRGYGGGGGQSRRARERMEEELRTIAGMGFAGYFLTVAEVVDLIEQMNVRVAARGSGAGSLVNHLLGISGVDPLRHGLLMERFLSPLRRVLPDIDIDVESARRTEIYQRILDRFGGQRCTCVSMMDTYRVRHAVRDVGGALGMLPGDVDEFAKAFPHIRAREARNALQDLPELRASSLGRMASQGRLDRFLDLVESLDGLPRHVALHPCGVLLSDSTLLDRTPVESSWMGFPMSQFDKDDVEEMGLLKLDVLGIRMQSAIAHAVDEIARVEGQNAAGAGANGVVDVDALPLDDDKTFDLIRSTRTLGCFQIESPGQRELIGKFAPQSFNDVIIDISLFRPGPVKSDMVTPFLRSRHGWQEEEYLHPDLKPVLSETSGVVVFHEQVMQILATITGCSLAKADEIRRTLGSQEGQDEVHAWFYPAALRRGYDLPTVEAVWDVLMAFASFGFCKAHAAAFAMPTYQSAWLKAHHPAAFLAGVLTHDPGMYPKRLILDDARNFGVVVRGVDINRSDVEYRVEVTDVVEPAEPTDSTDGRPLHERSMSGAGSEGAGMRAIRVPLSEVKGISQAEVARIVAGQPYESLEDCWHRAAPSVPVGEKLVLVGAFDSLYGIGSDISAQRRGSVTRRDLLLSLADLDRQSRSRRKRARRSRPARSSPRGRSVTYQALPRADRVAAPRSPARGPGGDRSREPVCDPNCDPAALAEQQSQAAAQAPDPDHLATQLTLGLGEPPGAVGGAGLPEMGPAERVRAELEVLGLDVSHHVVDFYRPMLADLAVVRSSDLVRCRSRAEILVAGVKVATQTPPVRSGRRVIFLTVDDGSGPADAAFFEDVQDDYAHSVFHRWTLLVRGEVRRTGPRGVSLRATGAWDLREVHKIWQAAGVKAVTEMLDASSRPQASPGSPARGKGERGTRRRRVLVHPSGYRMNVYADVKPAGAGASAVPSGGPDEVAETGEAAQEQVGSEEGAPNPPAKLWHASPGSSGW